MTVTENDERTIATEDRAGRIEVRGIDVIPAGERHGRARELFGVWAASNITYLYIVIGGTLTLLGLTVWQALTVVVFGNAFWALVGLLSVSGPASGTPSGIVMRAMFGVRANRVNLVVTGWAICVAYVAINLSVGSLAGFAIADTLGLPSTFPVRIAVVAVVSVLMIGLSVYGHATIVRFSGILTVVLAVGIGVLAVFVIGHADLSAAPAAPPVDGAWWIGLTIIASGPLSWGTGADYARYLPADTPPRAVAGWTALGGFLPATVLAAIGVLAGTAVDMTDPQVSLAGILPAWFYPVFLLMVVLGSITNGVLTAYSSGLAVQAVGIRARRATTVLVNGAVAVALTAYALFVSNFLDTLNSVLELSVALLGPSLALYGADIVLRMNRTRRACRASRCGELGYSGRALHDVTGPFRFRGGVNWAGVSAQVLGTTAALLCINTTLFTGPVASALGGADLSALAGPVVAAGVYVAVTRWLAR